VAVDALNKALVYAMTKWAIKFGPHLGVTLITELGLTLDQ
jgi:hypothetical protein